MTRTGLHPGNEQASTLDGAAGGDTVVGRDGNPQTRRSVGRRYAPLVTAFTFGASLLAHAAARRHREPDPDGLELLESALATFFLARLVAHEKVGAIVREPFVEPAPGTDPDDARGASKQPASGDGLRHTMGELVTCTRCLGPWAASAVTFSQAFAPRHARISTRVLALAGANVLAQATQSALATAANGGTPSD